MAKSVEKTYPVYKMLRRLLDKKTFRWTEEAESAFYKLNTMLSKIPTLTLPIPGEVLTMYLSASRTTTNIILVANREDKSTHIFCKTYPRRSQDGILKYRKFSVMFSQHGKKTKKVFFGRYHQSTHKYSIASSALQTRKVRDTS